MRAVRIGGHIALIGVFAGAGAEVNPMPILMKNVRVQGIFVGSRAMFEAMNRAIAIAGLHPVIDRVFDFDQAVAGVQTPRKRRSLRQGGDPGVKLPITFDRVASRWRRSGLALPMLPRNHGPEARPGTDIFTSAGSRAAAPAAP